MTRRPLALLLLAGVSVLAGCGSQLTEAEVRARSGAGATVEVPADTTSGDQAGAVADSPAAGPTAGGPALTTPGEVARSTASTVAGPTVPGASTATTRAAATGASTACATKATGPIPIATVGNYSGAGGSAQGGFPPAIQAWAASINAKGGLCGRPVQVIVQDDGGDQARYAALVKDSVENRKVVAFVGNGAVLSASGGIEYHKRSGVPVVGNDCTNDHWFHAAVLFPTCSSPLPQVIGALANGMAVSGTDQFGYVYCTEAQTCLDVDTNLQRGGVQGAGAKLLYRDSVSIAQIDFTAECQAARSAGVTLLWVAADPATVARMVQSCSRQSYFPKYFCGSVSCGADLIKLKGYESAAFTNPVFPWQEGSGGGIDEYNRARRAYAPDVKPSADFAIGWASAKLFELGATKAAQATGDITPAAIVAALHGLRDETLNGLTPPLNFADDGAHPKSCTFLLQGNGAGTGYTLPKGSGGICR